MTEQLTREEAERRWGPDPLRWPAWTCTTCQQRHSGWATDCPRCGAVRTKPDLTIWNCELPLIPHDHIEQGCKGTTYVRESEMNERVEEKLKDREFRERLKRLMDEERDVLERLAHKVPGEEPTEPWGYKVTIHVYVEGDINRAADVSDFYASLAPTPEPEFVGIGISEVAKRPVDQGSN